MDTPPSEDATETPRWTRWVVTALVLGVVAAIIASIIYYV